MVCNANNSYNYMDRMKIMLEVMIKINDDTLLNELCIFVRVFWPLFDQKYLASKFITFQFTSSVDFLEIRKEQ